MFWGNQGGGRVATVPEWAERAFEFTTARDVEGTGTLHFRFGHIAGQVWVADVGVVEAASGRDILAPGSFATPEGFKAVWNIWPPDKKNTVGKVEIADGALHVTLTAPAGGDWPDFHLHSRAEMRFRANVKYRCSFRVRATPGRYISPAVYSVEHGTWNLIGSPPGLFLEQVAMARDAGVDLVSFAAPNCWGPPEKDANWGPLDDLCQSILVVNPKALLLPRVGADAPGWWLEQHPDAAMIYEGGVPRSSEPERGVRGEKASVCDRQYRADAAAHLERICRHLMEKFPENFAGIHPCGQNTGEWFYEDTWRRPLSGYDPATLKAWREWLRARGVPDAEKAEVPTPEARHAAPDGVLRDPAKERRLIDFARFQQEEMADMVLALANAARRGTDGKKLVVFFYG